MKVAILGFGVVGSGVAEVLERNADRVEKACGFPVEVARILDIRDFEGHKYQRIITKNFEEILGDDSIETVVETMGGVNPAFEFVSRSLAKGKNVVSSNKELVATRGYELLELARQNNVNFMFEAAVGGGIPIIRPISRCLAGNNITEVAGILNGTSNFILTKMIVDGMSFGEALALAQEKGYAEKDPTADVEGIDAMRKICILASLAFGYHVYPEGIFTEGISAITLEDVAYAADFDCVIKLIAKAKRVQDGRILVMVSPCLVKKSSMLSGVSGVFNACLVRGDMTGDILMYGKGAGSLATASAVVGDIIDCAGHSDNRKIFGWDDKKDDYLEDHLNCDSSLYVRVRGENKAEIHRAVDSAFGEVTYLKREGADDHEAAFVTAPARERTLFEKLEATGLDIISTIRVADY